jgi:hypothetical protein
VVNADKLGWSVQHVYRCFMGMLAGLSAVLAGCSVPAAARNAEIQWPEDENSIKLITPATEAGAALAAAGAIRELIRTNTSSRLFWGCSSPEQGLAVAVFTGPTPGLYYVVLEQRFDRCGGPSGRVLDWWHVYAVTPQGEVLSRAPLPDGSVENLSPPSSQTLPSQEPPVLLPSPVPPLLIPAEESSHALPPPTH